MRTNFDVKKFFLFCLLNLMNFHSGNRRNCRIFVIARNFFNLYVLFIFIYILIMIAIATIFIWILVLFFIIYHIRLHLRCMYRSIIMYFINILVFSHISMSVACLAHHNCKLLLLFCCCYFFIIFPFILYFFFCFNY